MFKKAFTSSIHWGTRIASKTPKQAFLASSILGLSLYLANQKQNTIYATAKEQQPRPSISKKVEEKDKKGLVWEVFNEEKYQEVISQGKNVIIFFQPSRFNDSFQQEIELFMENLNNFYNASNIANGRQIVFMKLEFGENFKLHDLTQKHEIEIENETLFLFKNKYSGLQTFNFTEYFTKIDSFIQYFKEVPLLNSTHQQTFLSSISSMTSDTIIIAGYCPKSNPIYERLERRMGLLKQLKTYSSNKNVHFLFIDEEETAKQLGLTNLQIGDLFFLTKKSKMSYNKSTHTMGAKEMNVVQFASLKDKVNEIISKLNQKYNQANIFTSASFDQEVQYSLVLQVDENRIAKKDKQKLIEIVGEWKKYLENYEPELLSKVKFIFNKKKSDSKEFQIFIRDDTKYENQIKLYSIRTQEELKNLNLTPDDSLPHSYSYNFPTKTTTPDPQSLTQWFKDVENKKVKESFESQAIPNYRKYSKKLVRETFQQLVQDNQQDQAVFFYSKHCHACKQYGHFYENLALEHLRKDQLEEKKIIEFNRMNSDRNTLKTAQNFPYTPVFMIFKKQDKKNAYIYRSGMFTPQLLRNFIEVTSDFELIDPSLIEKQVKQNKKVNISTLIS